MRNGKRLAWFVASAALLLAAGPASAQTSSSGSAYSGSSSSTGSSSGTSAGATGTAPASFTGSTFGTALSGNATNTNKPGSTGVMGRYLTNPLALGVPASTAAQNSSNKPLWYTQALPFGTSVYNITTSTLGSNVYGAGTAALTTNKMGFAGASSVGVRRTPSYSTVLAFDHTPRSIGAVRIDLEQVLSRADRLPSRANIRVVMDGKVIVLRGTVAKEQERRLAEALVRLTPGVREVRNEIAAPPEVPLKLPSEE